MCTVTYVVHFLQKWKSLKQLGKAVGLFENFYPTGWVGFLHQLQHNLRISSSLGELHLKLLNVSFKTDTIFSWLT